MIFFLLNDKLAKPKYLKTVVSQCSEILLKQKKVLNIYIK